MRPVLRSWIVLFVAAILFVGGLFWLRSRPQEPEVADPLAEARESLDRVFGLEIASEVAAEGGVRVEAVKAGSPAEWAGIKGGDRIVVCGDLSVWHAQQLADFAAELISRGLPVVLLVEREGSYRPAVLTGPRGRPGGGPVAGAEAGQ